jgi:hypothetical protein
MGAETSNAPLLLNTADLNPSARLVQDYQLRLELPFLISVLYHDL